MRSSIFNRCAGWLCALFCVMGVSVAHAQTVTFLPYIQPGDSGPMGPKDQMVVAWQTDEKSANDAAYKVTYYTGSGRPLTAKAHGRVVDNYLSVDPQFSNVSTTITDSTTSTTKTVTPYLYGAHSDYYALLPHLKYNTAYTYTVRGPGLPAGGFTATFHTRKTGDVFSFEVEGDEGFFPPYAIGTPKGATNDYEGRIVHEMYDVANLKIAGAPKLPRPDFNLNAGDNCYNAAADNNYRDQWMNVWNNSTDNLYGAPYIRSIPFYVTVGNHDLGGSGAGSGAQQTNLFSNPYSAPFNGLPAGDALATFNNFYDPLNGPTGVDIAYVYHGDNVSPTGLHFVYDKQTFTSPAAMEAMRASTTVDTGGGVKRQIDHECNYSFDYGNAHIVSLDANPHLFDFVPTYDGPWGYPPTFDFPPYPTILGKWLINDLDQSNATWKFVIFHQPAFSSGSGTVSDDNMRRIAKLLEDHGVNVVFNGHEHNYQRTWPLRALPALCTAPSETGPAKVAIDTNFDGAANTVPDGVVYLVEGAGGNYEFDQGPYGPRWKDAPSMLDGDDSVVGMYTPPKTNYSFPEGKAAWLDTHLSEVAMSGYIPNAGSGPKITVKFKSKVFSFGDVLINGNTFSLYQISEPLTSQAAATTADNPIPWGTDYLGKPLNTPLPPTYVDTATGKIISGADDGGQPALLDKFTITRPDVSGKLLGMLTSPQKAAGGTAHYTLSIANFTRMGLNGVQAVFHLAPGMSVDPGANPGTTVHGSYAVVTVGRLDPSGKAKVGLTVQVAANASKRILRSVSAEIRSSTAQPVATARR